MEIKSDYCIPIEDIENNFKVQAGPGAGKTYWLVNHIKNVLKNSKRLQKTRKIACITYTNISVNTINERLGNYSEQVEVSTIHSFLYSNVFKPYIRFIADRYELDFSKVKGHEDVKTNTKNVIDWMKLHSKEINSVYLYNKKETVGNWLKTLKYKFTDPEDELIMYCNNYYKVNAGIDMKDKAISKEKLYILEQDLISYKKMYWREGIVSHDDILFFSYQLLKENPLILRVLNAKYPYFFIDEIQDTHPIQLKIIEMIARNETVVGLIGDKAQSIYSFQGTKYSQFEEIELKNVRNYQIVGNRRSTKNIINVLNSMRKDIQQQAIRDIDGNKPIIIIGDKLEAIKKYNMYKLITLSRKNITANEIDASINLNSLNENLEQEHKKMDTTSERRHAMTYITLAIESAKKRDFKEALKYLDKIDINRINKEKELNAKKKLEYLKILLDGYENYSNNSLKCLHEYINENLDNIRLARLSISGNPNKFYDETKYKQFVISLKSANEKSYSKTIHQSKGDEFENVMLIKEINRDDDLDFLINPDLENNEEHRVCYVAMSRAKDNLFINISKSPKKKDIERLKDLFEIENLNKIGEDEL